MKILIGEISSYKAIVISRYLKHNYTDIKIFSYDKRKFTQKIRSKYSDKHFCISSNDFEKELSLIIKEFDIDFFFPVINESLSNLWYNKNLFGKSLDYLGDFKSYTLLNDKLLLHDLAKKLNILVPKRYENTAQAKIPYVIKPINLSSAKGVRYINNTKDIPEKIDLKNIIIQQYVKGDGVGFSFYSKNGIISNGFGHKRLCEYPISGGSSTYRTNYKDDRMFEAATKIVKHLNYTGFAMFEFKLTNDNELYLLEVNPRIWGSIYQGLANGKNYFEEILGKPDLVKQLSQSKDKNTYLAPLLYLSLFKYALKFNFKPLLSFISNMAFNKSDVKLVSDPKGYLSTILRKVGS